MKIIITLLVLILNSCSLSGNQNLLGDDFQLFKNTTAWPLAVAVDNEDTAEIRKQILCKKILGMMLTEPVGQADSFEGGVKSPFCYILIR